MSVARKTEIHHHAEETWVDRLGRDVAPYRRVALAAVLAVLVGIVGWTLFQGQNEKKIAKQADEYAAVEVNAASEKEILSAITQLGATPSGYNLRLRYADFLAADGTQKLFSDKVAGAKRLEEAKTEYTAVNAGSKNGVQREKALLGLGMVEESLGDLAGAKKHYETQISTYPDGLFLQVAKDRLTALKPESSTEFYKWFKTAEVAVAAPNSFPDFSKGFDGSGLGGAGGVPNLGGPGLGNPNLGGPGFGVPNLGPSTTTPNDAVPGSLLNLPPGLDPTISTPNVTPSTTMPDAKTPETKDDAKSSDTKAGDATATPDAPAPVDPAPATPAKEAPAAPKDAPVTDAKSQSGKK
ncbi:MAG: hypothetical protein QM811_14560 [Pirellulales bacterium]